MMTQQGHQRHAGWQLVRVTLQIGIAAALGLAGTAQSMGAGRVEAWRQPWRGMSPTGLVEQLVVGAVSTDRDGNLCVTASARNVGSVWEHTAKYSGVTGEMIWVVGVSNPYDDVRGLWVNEGDQVIVTKPFGDGSGGAWTRVSKYDGATGRTLWEKDFRGVNSAGDTANAVTTDPAGNVVVAGYSDAPTGRRTALVIKYAADDGSVQWTRTYDGAGLFDEARSVRSDQDGNIAVTGFTYDATWFGDCFVVKYRSTDGGVAWDRRYREPGTDANYGLFLENDAVGSVVVAGFSELGCIRRDYLTLKYSAGDGVLLWNKRYNGPAGASDELKAMALDAAGNVVVTGASYSAATDFDFQTINYAAADGAVRWEQRHGGPGATSDGGQRIAVDANGTEFVGGSIGKTEDLNDCATIAYSSAGLPVWTNQLTFGTGTDDRVVGITVGAGGSVYVLVNSTDGKGIERHWTVKYSSSVAMGERLAGILAARNFRKPYANGAILPFDEHVVALADSVGERELCLFARADGDGFQPRLDLLERDSRQLIATAGAEGPRNESFLLWTNRPSVPYVVLVSSPGVAEVGHYNLALYPVVRPGGAISGELDLNDAWTTNRTAAVGSGRWQHDDYLLRGVGSGERMEILVDSAAFAPFLELRLLSDESVQDYRDGSSYSLTVQGTAQGPRDYLIRVTSSASGALGDYTLRVNRVQAAPEVWSLNPGSGVPGTKVLVRGTNFLDGLNPVVTGVEFGSAAADWNEPVAATGAHEFETTVPPSAVSGPIRVLTAGATGASTNAFIVLCPVGDVRREPGGAFSFSVSNAVAGVANVVERAATLTPPIAWTPVSTNAALVGRYIIEAPATGLQEFFRVRVTHSNR